MAQRLALRVERLNGYGEKQPWRSTDTHPAKVDVLRELEPLFTSPVLVLEDHPTRKALHLTLHGHPTVKDIAEWRRQVAQKCAHVLMWHETEDEEPNPYENPDGLDEDERWGTLAVTVTGDDLFHPSGGQ